MPKCPFVMACASSVLALAGCAGLGYSRISGETYFGWLASSTRPVVQYRDCRWGQAGVRLDVSDEKMHFRFFVTNEEVASAAKRHPDRVLEARSYQQAYLMGLASGMADGLKAARDGKLTVPSAPPVPESLTTYNAFWQEGWKHGYRYGYREIGASLRGCADDRVAAATVCETGTQLNNSN